MDYGSWLAAAILSAGNALHQEDILHRPPRLAIDEGATRISAEARPVEKVAPVPPPRPVVAQQADIQFHLLDQQPYRA
jgi:hypothetical protein